MDLAFLKENQNEKKTDPVENGFSPISLKSEKQRFLPGIDQRSVPGRNGGKKKMLARRLEYLRNVRKLRLIEYLKGAYVRPEWMIISLLPVLPPDLRPIISNVRGYITGDINLHYQNIVYRNNMIERLANVFWVPKKFVSLKKIHEQFNFSLNQNTNHFRPPFTVPSSFTRVPLKLPDISFVSRKSDAIFGEPEGLRGQRETSDFNSSLLSKKTISLGQTQKNRLGHAKMA